MHRHLAIHHNSLLQLNSSGTTKAPKTNGTAITGGNSFESLLPKLQNLPSGAGSSAKPAASPVTTFSGIASSIFNLDLGALGTNSAGVAAPTTTAQATSPTAAITIPAATQTTSSTTAQVNPLNSASAVGVVDQSGPSDPVALKAQAAAIQDQLTLFNEDARTYNDLCKAIALAGASPPGYVSTHVSPTILQGPGVTDQIGGVTIPRADLYYAHDISAQISQTLRSGGIPTLPAALAANPGVKEKFDAYVSAFKAMPTFAGPIGLNIPGYPSRSMSGLDADFLQSEADAIATQLQTATAPV